MLTRLKTTLTIGALVGASFLLAPAAVAGDEVIGSGRVECKADSDAEVRLRVEVDEEGRFNVIGVVFSDDVDIWSWRMLHNDDVSYKGEVQAEDADRSFRIQRSMVDLPGRDDIVFRAVNQSTDEVCRAQLEID